jgi:hypothetical protein
MDKKVKHIIDNNIEQVQSILLYLQKEYGLNFVLSTSGNVDDMKKLIVSSNANDNSFNFLAAGINEIIMRRFAVNKLLSEGVHLVECIDASDKPVEAPDDCWLKIGEVYIVCDIIKKNGEIFYRLQGKDNQPIQYPFVNKRFRRVQSVESLN